MVVVSVTAMGKLVSGAVVSEEDEKDAASTEGCVGFVIGFSGLIVEDEGAVNGGGVSNVVVFKTAVSVLEVTVLVVKTVAEVKVEMDSEETSVFVGTAGLNAGGIDVGGIEKLLVNGQ